MSNIIYARSPKKLDLPTAVTKAIMDNVYIMYRGFLLLCTIHTRKHLGPFIINISDYKTFNACYLSLFTAVYNPGGIGSSLLETCQRSYEGSNITVSSEDCGRGLLNKYKYMFIFGQLLHGIGATPLYTLGVSYLDDNLLPATTSLYVGE